MLFNSLAFAVFFPIVTSVFFLLPGRVRWAWLLLASCYFYAAFIPAYLAVLFLTIAVDYAAAIRIASSTGATRKAWLIFSIVVTVLILVVFKYFNFLSGSLGALAGFLGWSYPIAVLELALPIGLSFHTFQSLSYVFEVYRGRQQPERHFGIYALYVMFFPQLVAGPIERPQNLLHQFHEDQRFDGERVADGLSLIGVGLLKKVLVADRLAVYVDEVFGNYGGYSTLPIAIAIVFFSFQIYADFSGYSDIARGTARVLGFELMVNFDRPYAARSIGEFWRRWHISLSTWFRDYVYVPLGGSQAGRLRHYRNLLVVFLVSGLWHGAAWTFVIWGALHGVFLIGARALSGTGVALVGALGRERFPRVMAAAETLATFALVSLAWVFFRASSLTDAFAILGRLLQFEIRFELTQLCAERGPVKLVLCVAAVIALLFGERLWQVAKRRSLSFAVVATVLLVIGGTGAREFVYFQF